MFTVRKLIVVIAVVSQLAVEVQSKYGNYKSENDKLEDMKRKTSKGFGISAWGLVFLIVVGILLGVAAYYVAIFYPFLCKRERKYDRIELATI